MENHVRPLKMTEKMPAVVDKYWQDVWERKRDGNLVAWCSGASPLELLKAMDIDVVYPESYAGLCSAAGMSTEQCQRADALGYSSDLCSSIRTFIGAVDGIPALDPEKLPYGGMPKPDIMICNPYCPGIYRTWVRWSRYFDVPLLVMERPRVHDSLSEKQFDDFIKKGADELREMAMSLERITGRHFDDDRLSRILAMEKEASLLWWDALDMCRNIPSPMSSFDAFTHFFPLMLYRGSPEAVTYYDELKSELAKRVADNVGALTGEEKYRLYWDNLPIFFKLKEHMDKFASYGAVPVLANSPFYYGYFPDKDRTNPMEIMSELLFFNPSNRGLKRRIDFVTGLMDDYSLDGLVMQRTRTCLVVNMGQDDIMKALIKKTGLPAVVVEGDMCDTRFYSDSEFNKKIDAFMEILIQQEERRY